MAVSYPGIGYLKGYNTDRDIAGEFFRGLGLGKGVRDEAEAPDAFAKALPPLQEYGLGDSETMRALFANPNTRDMAIAQVKEAQQRRADANDPLKQLQLRKAQYDVDNLGRVDPTASMREFAMAQSNPKFAEFIGASGAGKAPAEVQSYLFYRNEEQAAGREPLPFMDFKRALKSEGLAVQTNPDGTVSITQGGASMPKLTEQQSKDVVYLTRGSGALPVLDEHGSNLTNPVERAMGIDPTGIIRQGQSAEFQQADQAGREFLQAILRKDTGAAITSQEMDSYGKTYLPMPGDGPDVLAQKRQARRRALDALELGIPSSAILTMEQRGALPREAQGLPEGVTEEDITFTMQKHGLTREQVLEQLNGS